ncbi:MAG: hypothetical protein AB8G86_21780 [Saprospiraceae bacterium]
MRQVTPTETQELFNLVERHAIKYYDVQIEIVDHYASAIEEIWENEPDLSFLAAQKRIYKEFWDFKTLEFEKRKSLNKRFNKAIWTIFRQWFKLPKLILTVLFVLCLFYLFNQTEYIQKYVMLGIFSVGMLLNFYPLWKYFQLKRDFKKEFLQMDCVIASNSMGLVLAMLPINWLHHSWSHFYDLPFAIFTIVWGLNILIGYQILERNIHFIKSTYLKVA